MTLVKGLRWAQETLGKAYRLWWSVATLAHTEGDKSLKNGLPYYKAYPRDFIEGTIGMPFEVKCAYRVVLDLIYMQGGELPDDARYISGLLGCSIRKWKSIREQLVKMDKLQVSGEFLTNYRAVSEVETLTKLRDKQAENGAKTKVSRHLQKPRLNHTEPEPEPYKRVTKVTHKKPDVDLECLDILSQIIPSGLAQEWISHRRDMKKPMTVRAAAAMVSKCSEYPDPSPAFLDSIANGYQGIFPEKHKGQRNGKSTREEFDTASREYARRLSAGEINHGPDASDPYGQ